MKRIKVPQIACQSSFKSSANAGKKAKLKSLKQEGRRKKSAAFSMAGGLPQ
jgi:hypothetical protein